MGIAFRNSAMSLRPAVPVLLAIACALPLPACTPPRSAVIVDCVTSMETTFTRARECRLRVAAFDRRTAATLRGAAPSFHRGFELDGDFGVERGRVRVTVRGSGEPAVFTVAPGQPWQGRIVALMTRKPRDEQIFTIALEPEGEASGFHAAFRYRSVQRAVNVPTSVIPRASALARE